MSRFDGTVAVFLLEASQTTRSDTHNRSTARWTQTVLMLADGIVWHLPLLKLYHFLKFALPLFRRMERLDDSMTFLTIWNHLRHGNRRLSPDGLEAARGNAR